MKDKKRVGKIVFGVICVIIVIVCVIIQIVLKNEDKKLEKKGEKFKTLIVETKSGNKIETEYVHVDDEEFYFKVPKNFKQLDYATIIKKYSGFVHYFLFYNY